MDINKYLLFVRAVDTGNLSKAAAQMNYSQTAASHMLASMEEELGQKLLYRGRNGVSLTEEGERVYPLAKEIVEREEAIRELTGEGNIYHGKIRVGVITSAAVSWMPQIFAEFRKLHPLVELIMYDALNNEIMKDWFSRDFIDCAITAEANSRTNRNEPLIKDPYYVIMPDDHMLRVHHKITPQLLTGEAFIVPSEGTSYEVGKIIRQAKGKTTQMQGFLSDQAAISMVRAGCGISIMPKLVLDAYGSKGYIRREFEPEVCRIIYFCLPAGKTIRPITKSFADFVTGWVREHGKHDRALS